MSVSDQSAAGQATSTTQLPALPTDWQPVCYAVLADGTLAVLATDVDLQGEYLRVTTAFETSVSPDLPSRLLELSTTGSARIWTAASAGWIEGPTFPLETPFARFDRFSDGRWLIAALRFGGKANARVLTSDGAVLARLTLGEEIEHVAIDLEDRIWVGWNDQGTFGNFGWQVPGQEWPPSSEGVACFLDDGSLVPLPDWPDEAESITDCYALNVMGPGVWVCAYAEFPLVRLVPGEPARWWRSDISGATAIAIDGEHVLLAGGYSTEANRLALLKLEGKGLGEQVPVLATWTLPLRPLPPPPDNGWAPTWDRPSLLTGRGDTLHLVDEGLWYRWRVRDLASPDRPA
jgi:hypothetical protein